MHTRCLAKEGKDDVAVTQPTSKPGSMTNGPKEPRRADMRRAGVPGLWLRVHSLESWISRPQPPDATECAGGEASCIKLKHADATIVDKAH